jgi:hypothetical protein
MKRHVTTIGVGLSLLIGVSGAVVLFPNVVGASISHGQAATGVRSLQLSSAATSHPLRASLPTVGHAVMRGHHGSTLGMTRRLARTTGRTGFRATPATSGRVRSFRLGTLARGGRGLRFSGMARSGGGARTGHSCPGGHM